MAKDFKQGDSGDNSLSLAEQLFVAHWRPNSGYGPEKIAADCIEAAAAFERTAKTYKPSSTAIPFAGAKASLL